ncbi:hypothetical protein EPA93_03260 [Ktedonosporobacter rubrisoli]|uniref:VOC domain-containing protein n=1 Tax=Ktedonosporobacter rubrisoli TaxID=2509675 RepID=A0A4P6JIZ4_KTERU|nr:VOC family protein [Ktedonosporobacter rubrisoli]QBD75064.1 hypothetical protein EPA93_03260 [Ktedonosporobacter rubrisoli]
MTFSAEEATHELTLAGLTLRVQSVERSLEFYTKLPGVKVVVHRPGYFAMLRIGAGRLGLLQQEKAPLFHLELETSQELEGFAQQLRASGIEHVKLPAQKRWGEFDFTVQDPDGHVLEFESAQEQQKQEAQSTPSTTDK